MIESCVKSTVTAVAAAKDSTDASVHPRGTQAILSRDPHTSLSLFGPRDESDQTIASVISPKAGVRPRQRSFTEILGDEPVGDPASPSTGRQSGSPSKVIAPKAGAGKNFQPSRLFDTEEEDKSLPDDEHVPDRFYRPHPTKYEHFDFADGSDPHDAPHPGDPTFRVTKHSSQWGFEDFVTPAKKPAKAFRDQDVRHWGTEDDDLSETPQPKAASNKPRRDAETHFEFIDDGIPKGEPRASRPRGATHNTGSGLYENNLYYNDVDEPAPTEDGRALGVITNVKVRGRDFDSHFAVSDHSPAQAAQSRPVADDRKKAVKMMEANWASYDVSPAQKENHRSMASNGSRAHDDRGIHVGGDGMGGGKGSNRNWLFGNHEDKGQPAPGRKPAAKGFNWDF